MPTGTPSLDNFTKNDIDALTISLDSASFLTQVDWSNPTLEQLDAWGDMDSLDGFGNLEQLALLDVLHFQGTAGIVVTAAGAVQFAIEMPAAVSISATATAAEPDILFNMPASASAAITASSEVNRVKSFSASVSGAASFAAVITPLRQVSSSVSLAVTASNDYTRFRTDTGSASFVVTSTSKSNYVFNVHSAVDASISATGAAGGIFVMAGTPQAQMSVSADAKRLGEDWSDVGIGNEIWTNVTIGSEIWSKQTTSTGTWAGL
jgi:hypothetical protein